LISIFKRENLIPLMKEDWENTFGDKLKKAKDEEEKAKTKQLLKIGKLDIKYKKPDKKSQPLIPTATARVLSCGKLKKNKTTRFNRAAAKGGKKKASRKVRYVPIFIGIAKPQRIINKLKLCVFSVLKLCTLCVKDSLNYRTTPTSATEL
jgi:hypothetical protein